MPADQSGERGFSMVEVAIASVVTLVGLVALASMFTLAMSQNRMVTQHTTTTAIAQQKMEELNAIEPGDARLNTGGGLTEADKRTGFWDSVFVDPQGTITTTIPAGESPMYRRYWQVEDDPQLPNTVLISVRVTGVQPSRGNTPEQTTLTTVRSW
jgi:Tfp pilus assembly protein PilV